jgi:hypothetical protein
MTYLSEKCSHCDRRVHWLYSYRHIRDACSACFRDACKLGLFHYKDGRVERGYSNTMTNRRDTYARSQECLSRS